LCTTDLLIKAAEAVHPQNVVAVTSDSASVMVAGKKDFLAMEEFQHILNIP
jgi:hypothetical protein